MLNIMLNENLEKPLYKQVMIEIKEGIISGKLKEQEKLPSIRILAKQLKISVITVKRAYEELKKVGLVYGIAGKGFYVADNNIDILQEKRKSIIIDETSMVPIFVQIADWIKEEILQEKISEGNQVPSINQIASMNFINPVTVKKGFNLLEKEGILYKKRGIGMFVKAGVKKKIYENAKEHFLKKTLQHAWQEARKLGMTKEDVIELLKEIEI